MACSDRFFAVGAKQTRKILTNILVTIALLCNSFFIFLPQQTAVAETQNAYRWRNNDGSEVTASWAAAENTALTSFVRGEETKRLRFGMNNSGMDTELLREAELRLNGGDGVFFGASTIDSSAGYAYFGSGSFPGKILKVRLIDFKVVNTLVLANTEDRAYDLTLDTANGYLYASTSSTPAKVLKISLTTFTEVAQIVFPLGENVSAWDGTFLDGDNDMLYVATRSIPSYVVKVDLSTFTRVGSIEIDADNSVTSIVYDDGNKLAYAATGASPAKVYKLDVSPSNFSNVTSIPLNSGENSPYGAVIDTTNGYAYFPTRTSPAKVVKVNVSPGGFARDSAITLSSGENLTHSGAIDVSGGYAYFGSLTSPARVTKVNISQGGFARDSGLILNSEEYGAATVLYDSSSGKIYVPTIMPNPSSSIVKILASTMTRDAAITFSYEDDYTNSVAMDSNREFMYLGTAPLTNEVARIIKVRLSDLSRVGHITLGAGEAEIDSMFIDSSGDYLYAVTKTSPTKLVKIRLSDFSRYDVLTLNNGENNAVTSVYDSVNNMAYIASTTAPAIIVKVNIATFTRVGAITLSSGENVVSSSVIDEGNKFALFGTFTNPGIVVKVDISPGNFSRVSAVSMISGENRLSSAVIDVDNGFAYFGTSHPDVGYVMKIDVSAMSRVGVVAMENGEFDFDTAFIDTVNGYAYFASDHTTLYSGSANALTRIDLESFTYSEMYFLNDGDGDKFAAVFDPLSGYAYVIAGFAPSKVLKISVAPKYNLSLEYGIKSTVCSAVSAWTNVPSSGAASTEHFVMSPTNQVVNGAATTNITGGVTDGETNFHSGYVMTSTATATEVSAGRNEFTEVEYSLASTSNAVAQQEYCFRVTNGGVALNSYSNYAEATVTTLDSTTNNMVVLSRLSKSSAADISIGFLLNNELDGTLTVTFPDGFVVTGPFTSGSCSGGGDIGTFAYTSLTLTAEKSDCSGSVLLSGATVTTPDTPGTYEISWVNDDPGSSLVIIVDDDQVTVSSNVDPSMLFDIDTSVATSADTVAPYTLDFGTLDVAATHVSGEASINYIMIDLATNAATGAIVTVNNANGSSGLVSISSPSDSVASASTAMDSGTENYGFCLQEVSESLGATFSKAGEYATGTCTDQADANDVKSLSATPVQMLSVTGPMAGGRAVISGSAAIDALIEAHDDYTDTLTFIATSTF